MGIVQRRSMLGAEVYDQRIRYGTVGDMVAMYG